MARLDDTRRYEIVGLVAERFAKGEKLDEGRVVADYRVSPRNARTVIYDARVRKINNWRQNSNNRE